ncbi:hypothetical protein WN944_008072 [Citrus x changshan-huyou]|uniref:Uncharacterized protein n=1 Tax=Citrus x changshan-huyou TaxID=2935761 RepID=A0AAP0MS96_9ROSI
MASGESRELKNNAILCYQRTASVWTERNVAFRSSLSLVARLVPMTPSDVIKTIYTDGVTKKQFRFKQQEARAPA